MKKLLLAILLALIPSVASAECNGLFPPLTICGNTSQTQNGIPTAIPFSSVLGNINLADAHILIGNPSNVAAPFLLSGDGTLSDVGVFTLSPSGVTAGAYGDGTHSTQVTFDAKGRATSASSVTITHASGDLALSGGAMSGNIAMGGNNVTGMGTLGSQWINNVIYADQMPAADMGAKINAALALLPASGGVVDARGLTGNQTLSTAVTCTNAEILFGQATIAQSATITEGQDCALVGLPGGIGQGNNFGLTRFFEANGANLPELILISGGQATLRDVVLDGNKANQTSAGPNLVITGSHYYLANLTIQNSLSHGYELQSSGTSNTACCGTVHNVMSIANGGDGLYCTGVADTMIDLSSFENNAGSAGVELNNCPTTRFSNFDIGGNQIGLWTHGSPYSPGSSLGSGSQIVGVGQFGNNAKQDISIDDSTGGSENNQIVGSEFYSSASRISNTYAAIDINEGTGGGSNIISGIGVQSPSGNTLTSAVYIHGASTGIDTVGPVVASGTFGGAPFNVPATTALLSACYNGTCTSQGQTLVKPVFTGNGSGYSATAKTAGASSSDQYALALNNPSTAAYSTVLGDFFAGGVNLAEIAAQRSNTSSGGSLFLYTYTTAGVKAVAGQIDPTQVFTFAKNPIISPFNIAGIVTNTSGGQLGTETQITVAQGGLGGNNSSASGIPIFASGVVTITAANANAGPALVNGTPTVGNCLKWSASGIQDAGSTCGGGTGSPGGSSGAIQYNNAGAFGGVTVASGDLMAGGGSGAPTDTGVPYNAIPAANSTFTGPGTGGVATSLQARMQGEYIDFSDYGADCTGATDSTAAFTNAFIEAQTLGVPLHECVGTIQVNITTPLSITSGMNIGGAGRGLSWIENTSLTGTLFSIATTSPIYVHDIGYEVSGTPTAGAFITDAGLSAAQNVHSIFDRIQCTNAYYCLYLGSSAYWNVDDSIFLNTVYRSIYVANTVNSDAGDSEISNSQFLEYQGNTCATTGVAIFQASSGGLRLVGNKFNCGSVQYNLQVAGSSSISLISGNSFENCSTHCIYITNTSSSYTWANVTISGNEISPYADVNAIYIQGSSGWLGNVSISGNTGVFAENSSAWARVDYATNLSFGVNSLSAPGTTSSYALDVSHGTVTSCHQVGNTVGSLTAVNGTCTNN